MLGRKVSIVEMMDAPNFGETGMHPIALSGELNKYGVKIYLSTRATEITPEGLEAEGPDGRLSLKADTVIYATGQKPLREEAMALSDFAGEFFYIGDCVTPKNILAATQSAYTPSLRTSDALALLFCTSRTSRRRKNVNCAEKSRPL
jgi:NADPH-dependent 2,4-dienoyl-CoA reductase/sulfur reductase-like enzyme